MFKTFFSEYLRAAVSKVSMLEMPTVYKVSMLEMPTVSKVSMLEMPNVSMKLLTEPLVVLFILICPSMCQKVMIQKESSH